MPPQPNAKPVGGRSVFQRLLLPLLLLVAVQVLILVAGLTISGVMAQLQQNARDILDEQVVNRRNYLESEMVRSWSDLSLQAETVNLATQQLLDSGALTLDDLNSSSDAMDNLILSLSDSLISTLYSKRLSGIFVVFNTGALPSDSDGVRRPGFYIRDMDPASPPSSRNADLLLERAPVAVVRSMNISTDSYWYPLFDFAAGGESGYYNLLYRPFQAAYEAEAISDPSDFGYWNIEPFALTNSVMPTITYSIPLVLEDGTVYGVLGVEVLSEYLKTLLPNGELMADRQGSYLLAVEEHDDLVFQPLVVNGPILLPQQQNVISLQPTKDGGYHFTLDGQTYYADVQYLSLYNSNTTFIHQKWALIGTARERTVYAFSEQVTGILLAVIAITFLLGAAGCIIISRKLSQPIRRLAEEVERAQHVSGDIPHLSATGIREIDQFSNAITSLSRDVLESSTKFLRIMEMASVDLAGFELRSDTQSVFVTDNYFPLLGVDGVEPGKLTLPEFQALVSSIKETLSYEENEDGSLLYCVPRSEGAVRYVRVEVMQEGPRLVGLAEDVTAATLERMRIEHERDYDLLTGLFNRRAFYRATQELFSRPEALKQAAFVMLDLDNLKQINDHFGHDWGDKYIRGAGQCFAASTPPGTLCARVSGDEFYLLFHGYDSVEEIRGVLAELTRSIRSSTFVLPSGEPTSIKASGGIAWYPGDSTDYNELMKFADFAMYQVKHSHKGELADFDLGTYNRANYQVQSHREFRRLMDEELMTYRFQPIVDARTGQIRAFEALMHVNMPTLRSPESVLQMAREEDRLHDVERLTWFKAAEAYDALLRRKLVPEDALLFINSIASQRMSDEERAEFHARFAPLQSRMVVEITEADDLDWEATVAKRETPGFSGMFALDDYGSGYNSEKNLLALSPQYIKVDISIIRDIDQSADKQQIVANIVSYAHARGLFIVAEGIETAPELRQVLELGVDLLQGYYLSRPTALPQEVNPSALAIIGGGGTSL